MRLYIENFLVVCLALFTYDCVKWFTLFCVVFYLGNLYWPKKSLRGEIVLITGGAGAFGRALCLKLAKLGATIVVWDINEEAINETVNDIKKIRKKAYGYICDVSREEDVYAIAERTRKEVGNVAILINNAGIYKRGALLDAQDEDIIRTFEVNTLGHFWTTKAFLPSMIERNRGHIVSIASVFGNCGIVNSHMSDYCASNSGIVGFFEALTVELEAEGITGINTTCISPMNMMSEGLLKDIDSCYYKPISIDQAANESLDAILKEDKMRVIGMPTALLASIFILPYWMICVMLKFINGNGSSGNCNRWFSCKNTMKNKQ